MSKTTKLPTITASVEINEDADQEPVAGILSRSEALKFLGVGETTGLVTVLRRSPISLCHLGLECERADAAQI